MMWLTDLAQYRLFWFRLGWVTVFFSMDTINQCNIPNLTMLLVCAGSDSKVRYRDLCLSINVSCNWFSCFFVVICFVCVWLFVLLCVWLVVCVLCSVFLFLLLFFPLFCWKQGLCGCPYLYHLDGSLTFGFLLLAFHYYHGLIYFPQLIYYLFLINLWLP